MPHTTAILTLLFGGVVPRLLPAGADGSPPGGAVAGGAMLDAAVADALALLRAGAIAAYADAPDIDFAVALSRYDAALGLVASAAAQAGADRRLRRMAGGLAAAATARRERLCAWQADEVAPTAWVAGGSSVPIRFVDSELRKDLTTLTGGDGLADAVRIAVAICRRTLELARIEMALGRDTRLKTMAIALVGTAADDIAELETWWREEGRAAVAMTAPVH